MKKIFMTMAAMVIAASASAQVLHRWLCRSFKR